METPDAFGLQRFVKAQEPVFADAISELRAGAKRSHWIWFIFPQIRGLGSSPTSHYYAINSLAEARAYLAHPTLGPRLELATEVTLAIQGRSLLEIFGMPDAAKFRSSMTLFNCASEADDNIFRRALDVYCEGRKDERTLALLAL